MKKFLSLSLVALSATFFSSAAKAAVIANWTFETSIPTTSGPHVAEAGVFAGTSTASSNSGGTFSNPVGNGSVESFSSNGWNDGEYYQFSTSSLGYENITVSYAQAASGTGPGNFLFQYSTDGINFTNFGTTYVGPTTDFINSTTFSAANVLSYDLTALTALNNQSVLAFRIAVSGSTAENGSAIASGGTFRVDDFVVNATAIPEPASMAMIGCALAGGYVARRRSKKAIA